MPLITCNLFQEFGYNRSCADLELLYQPRPGPHLHRPDPDLQLRDLATAVDITERHAHGIVADLADAGYVVKEKDGRRNRYRVQTQLPLPESISGERTIGEVLGLLVDADAQTRPGGPIKEKGHRS